MEVEMNILIHIRVITRMSYFVTTVKGFGKTPAVCAEFISNRLVDGFEEREEIRLVGPRKGSLNKAIGSNV
jgi:hypothetical protein